MCAVLLSVCYAARSCYIENALLLVQVICCEGNAAFYEAGMIEIPLSGMSHV